MTSSPASFGHSYRDLAKDLVVGPTRVDEIFIEAGIIALAIKVTAWIVGSIALAGTVNWALSAGAPKTSDRLKAAVDEVLNRIKGRLPRWLVGRASELSLITKITLVVLSVAAKRMMVAKKIKEDAAFKLLYELYKKYPRQGEALIQKVMREEITVDEASKQLVQMAEAWEKQKKGWLARTNRGR